MFDLIGEKDRTLHFNCASLCISWQRNNVFFSIKTRQILKNNHTHSQSHTDIGKGHIDISLYIFDTYVNWSSFLVCLYIYPCLIFGYRERISPNLKFIFVLIRLTFQPTWKPSKWLIMAVLLERGTKGWRQSKEIKWFDRVILVI